MLFRPSTQERYDTEMDENREGQDTSFSMMQRPLMLAAASGALSAVSIIFPSLFFLIWVAFVPLFVSLRGRAADKRLLLGFITGLTYFGGAYHWVWWSMTQFFAFSPFVALVLFLCFLVWNGLVFALFAAQPDAWQIGGHLTRVGFAGRLIALSPALPNRRMVERELRADYSALRLRVLPVLRA